MAAWKASLRKEKRASDCEVFVPHTKLCDSPLNASLAPTAAWRRLASRSATGAWQTVHRCTLPSLVVVEVVRSDDRRHATRQEEDEANWNVKVTGGISR